MSTCYKMLSGVLLLITLSISCSEDAVTPPDLEVTATVDQATLQKIAEMEEKVRQEQNTTTVSKEQYEEARTKLNPDITSFTDDYATWSQEEQKKIVTYDQGFMISGRLEKAPKYENSLGYWLDCRLTQSQIVPLHTVITYLKNQHN